jgi:small subunit ribosomal protein S6
MSITGEVLSLRNLRGTQREYETVVIVRPDVNKQGILALVGRIQAILGRGGSRLLQVENWGLRTLAYPIRRQKKGVYLYLRFLGGSAIVAELERNLRIFDETIRYLTVLVDEDVDAKARPGDVTAEQIDQAGEIAPDPTEMVAEAEAEGGDDAGSEDAGDGEDNTDGEEG